MEENNDMNHLYTLDAQDFQQLLDVLKSQGYNLIGPTVRDGAVVYDTVDAVQDLPVGWTDEHEAGTYRLKARGDGAFFGYTITPFSWKQYLHPPALKLWEANRSNGSFSIQENQPDVPCYAFIGVRACELAAIAIQDRVFMGGDWVDPTYRARREQAFIVAVNCGQAGSTCFCASMGTGPEAKSGFDLALTEITDGGTHYFVVETGSKRGEQVFNAIPHEAASADAVQKAQAVIQKTASNMGRSIDTRNIKEVLYRNYENNHWEEVASRCLACANCTMVCPTCFCTTVEDVTDLTGNQAERWRKWDSCFTMDFSYIHGGSVRYSGKARYRQWLTHKFATWQDQFDTMGCVGCGRCITWCPAGIDITEEVRAVRESEPWSAT